MAVEHRLLVFLHHRRGRQIDGDVGGGQRPDAHRENTYAQTPGRFHGRRSGVLIEVADHHHAGQVAGRVAAGQVVQGGAQGRGLALGRHPAGDVLRIDAALTLCGSLDRLDAVRPLDQERPQAELLRQPREQVVILLGQQGLDVLGAGGPIVGPARLVGRRDPLRQPRRAGQLRPFRLRHLVGHVHAVRAVQHDPERRTGTIRRVQEQHRLGEDQQQQAEQQAAQHAQQHPRPAVARPLVPGIKDQGHEHRGQAGEQQPGGRALRPAGGERRLDRLDRLRLLQAQRASQVGHQVHDARPPAGLGEGPCPAWPPGLTGFTMVVLPPLAKARMASSSNPPAITARISHSQKSCP